MAKVPGSIWVEGIDLHYVDPWNREWSLLGFYHRASPTAFPGSIFLSIETRSIHWIGENRGQYQLPYVVITNLPGTSAITGAIWIENDKLCFTGYDATATYDQKCMGHWDVGSAAFHTDTHSDQGHIDTAHNDLAHNDASTGGHVDYHYDLPHSDHTDQGHADAGHGDAAGSTFSDHGDMAPPWNPTYIYIIHADGATGNLYHGDYTSPAYHVDHTSYAYTSIPHIDGNQHTDVPHVDDAHIDGHSDSPHQDVPANFQHTDHWDSSHGDTPHTDVAHQDASHGDAHGDYHGDSPHYDTPTLIGP